MNFGATSETDSGLFFTWADATGYEGGTHTFSKENYVYGPLDDSNAA